MSKKRHKKESRNFPWLLVGLGGLFLIIAAVFLARQGGNSGGTPSIQVDQQKIDYGYVKFGEPRTFAINVTNTGTGTLRFQENPYIQVLEGC